MGVRTYEQRGGVMLSSGHMDGGHRLDDVGSTYINTRKHASWEELVAAAFS
jgi:hypothetical protein